MNVILLARVDADLEDIGDYIARDNPERAASFVRELRSRCYAIGDAPQAHAPRPELGRGLRCCLHGNYLIFFRVTREEVQVVRILHAARDLRQLARRGEVNEPAANYAVSDFEALGFLRLPGDRAFLT